MKKIILGVSAIVLIASAVFIGCMKEKEECKTCSISADEKIDVNLLNTKYTFGRYYNDPWKQFVTFNSSMNSSNIEIVNKLKPHLEGDTSNIQPNNTASLIYFTKNSDGTNEVSDIDEFIIVTRLDNAFKVNIYLRKPIGGFLHNSELSLSTNYISFSDIARIYFSTVRNKKLNCYCIFNEKLIKPFKYETGSLQNKLSQEVYEVSKKYRLPNVPDNVCASPPCSSPNKNETCIIIGKGVGDEGDRVCSVVFDNWSKDCYQEKVIESLNDSITYPSILMTSPSYSIRDNFLKGSLKGEAYIYYYYRLSELMPNEMDFSFALYINNTIVEDLSPLCQSLLNNSTSSEILITQAKYDKLIDKLNYLNYKLNNQEASIIINQVKNDLNLYKNKSVAYVYNSFRP